jgi:hypothetical protein
MTPSCSGAVKSAQSWDMLALTRGQSTDAREECWHIYYGDVHAGTIAIRTGIPHAWGWICGFYPGSEPGEQTTGTGATFEEARTAFDEAWRIFLSKRTEADFQARRDARDWTERKYAMWARGERLPSQKPSSLMTCPCGEVFDSHRLECTVIHVLHIGTVTAARQRS